MAGSLIKIAETTVSSAVASVTLTGIDSTYDVYKVVGNNVQQDTDSQLLRIRVTESGTPNTTANYDFAYKAMTPTASFTNVSSTNQTQWRDSTGGTSTQEQFNFVYYLFNMNSTTEYAFITQESTNFISSAQLGALIGGGVFTVTGTARDGVSFSMASGNIDSGTFTLYGLKK